jgi:ornithine cyclodeaminase/alanine dehydrogenase-like protein (mu-crystallin family)
MSSTTCDSLRTACELAVAVRDLVRLDQQLLLPIGSDVVARLVALCDAVVYGDNDVGRYQASTPDSPAASAGRIRSAVQELAQALEHLEQATCVLACVPGLAAEWQRCVERRNGLVAMLERLKPMAR